MLSPCPARETSAFERELREQIRADGALTLEVYIAACNAHYYATRDPLGAAGDFTTAPEISQMFGEIVGAALADCWDRAGRSADAAYAELGPGRGTLAADALSVLRRAGFSGAVHLVETSPILRAAQAERLGEARWHDSVATLPAVPLLLVANEFLDALPIRQWIGAEERRVTLDGDRLRFTADGAIREDSPARDRATAAIARHIAQHGGAALMIDYGHARSGAGDTLQAVRAHAFANPLDCPGEQDLTAHVDFQRITEVAAAAGAAVAGPVEQGQWLERLGIQARAARLAARAPKRAAEIEVACARLCRPDAMGSLFKVIALHAPDWPAPAGLA
ncbi:MAG: SAM-dependent methyltransferase [Sphingomicrobium sp.]